MTPDEQHVIQDEIKKSIARLMNFSFPPYMMPKKKDAINFILMRAKTTIYGTIRNRYGSYLKKVAQLEYAKALLQPEGKILTQYYDEESLRHRIAKSSDKTAINLIKDIKSEKSLFNITDRLISEKRLNLIQLMYENNLLKIEENHILTAIGSKQFDLLDFLFSKNLVFLDNLMHIASYQKDVSDKQAMQVYLLEKGVSILGTSDYMNASPGLDWIKDYAKKIEFHESLDNKLDLKSKDKAIKI